MIKIRRKFSGKIFNTLGKKLPAISETEAVALEAGDAWMEKGIFQGKPDWKAIHSIPKHELSKEEQSFMDNEVNQLCEMIDDWKVMQEKDFEPRVWEYMGKTGFFGMIIDKKYGGLGFSAKAHSDIVQKIATRSGSAAVTVMVPNSLGPGELLHHYGTEEQKDYFLPRLADGRDLPCFALTEVKAGSDATSIKAEAVVTEIDGQIGLLLNFSKRYITLAPKATVVGLAVQLKDPSGLLKNGREGITCLLLPRATKGLSIGNRHYASGLSFMNGTLRGKDIFVPMNSIIGGEKMAGEGWKMLVECLAIGRSISLPTLGASNAGLCTITTSAYSVVREQFGMKIGAFEGVATVLAKMTGMTYLTHANRELTVAAVDDGKKPSVASAIAKLHNTENGREILNDAMDVHAGRAVILGPRNYLSTAYSGTPVAITVEGANIMTRNLLVYGQGIMVCHKHLQSMVKALGTDKNEASIAKFDKLLFGMAGGFIANKSKSLFHGLTAGILVCPNHKGAGSMKKYYKQINRLSTNFAYLSDAALVTLGGGLKKRETLSARFGDVLSYLYMAAAVLKKYADEKQPANKPIAQWALQYALYQAQEALYGLTQNMGFLGKVYRFTMFPYGRTHSYPTDKLSLKVAKSIQSDSPFRDTLKKYIYMNEDLTDPVGSVEKTFLTIIENKETYAKVTKAVKAREIKKSTPDVMIKSAEEKGILSNEEAVKLLDIQEMCNKVIQVDEFEYDEMIKNPRTMKPWKA